jgi:hypothetical protein
VLKSHPPHQNLRTPFIISGCFCIRKKLFGTNGVTNKISMKISKDHRLLGFIEVSSTSYKNEAFQIVASRGNGLIEVRMEGMTDEKSV